MPLSRARRLVDASPEKILEEGNAIKLYISAVDRAAGKKTDPRKGVSNDILAAAKKGDKAGANAAIKQLVADTKLTKYVSDGIVSGSKFVDAIGLVSGEITPNAK